MYSNNDFQPSPALRGRSGVRYLSLSCMFLLVMSAQLTAAGQSEEEIIAKFLYRSHTYEVPGGPSITRPYRLFVPDNYDPGKRYPLVLTLHGGGETGNDNEIHIARYRLATSWADTVNQNRRPAFVLAPQAPDYSETEPFYQHFPEFGESLFDSLMSEFSIDEDRIYVTGLSMGGDGTWLWILARPNLFAAAVPMSGAPEVRDAETITHIPIWAFHGRFDGSVDVEESRAWITEFKRLGLSPVELECDLGGTCLVRSDCWRRGAVRNRRLIYTEYMDGQHDIWARSYNDPVLMEWVFDQRRGQPTVGGVGTFVTFDVDVSAVENRLPGMAVAIVGSTLPLEVEDPLPLCTDFAETIYGGVVAFPDTASGSVSYRFAYRNREVDAWIEESVGAGWRTVLLEDAEQVLPVIFWSDEGQQVPDRPVIVQPDEGVAVSHTTLVWASGAVAGRYEVEVDTSAEYQTPLYSAVELRQTSVQVSGLDTLRTYYWRVRASNATGVSEWQEATFFTLGLRTRLVEPADGAEDQSQDPTLRWMPYPGSSSYYLQLSQTPDFSGSTTIRLGDVQEYEAESLAPGAVYYWRVRASSAWPSDTWSFRVTTATARDKLFDDVPRRFALLQNYPNPFNPTTTISYELPQRSVVKLTVVDALGREVSLPESGLKPAGTHRVVFEASDLSSGVYFYRLQAGDFVETRRMVVVK